MTLFSTVRRKALPSPIITKNSVELCLNSRISYHEGLQGNVGEEWLSNVLWAAGHAPFIGNKKKIYVTVGRKKYLYDFDTHSLILKGIGYSKKTSLFIDFESELDAGIAYMFAILASVSLWNGRESQLASCPMHNKLYFGIRDVQGLNSELAVISSDGSLPTPRTKGENSLEDVIANLKYTDNFIMQEISLKDLSQLLWAGYGCTPHVTYNGYYGLTVPSWCAEYYLTENIYVVNHEGVFRYHNRNPNRDFTTKEHRLEQIQSNDKREKLCSAVKKLPHAGCYILLCLDAEDMNKWYARLEAGFVAGNMLLQASAMGMGCWFTPVLGDKELMQIRKDIEMDANDMALVVVSLGYVE